MKREKITAFVLVSAVLISFTGCQKAFPERRASGDYGQDFRYDFEDKDRHGIKSIDVHLEGKEEFDCLICKNDWSDGVPGIIGIAGDVFWYPTDTRYSDRNYMQDHSMPEPDLVTIMVNYDDQGLMGVPEKNILLLYAEDDDFNCSVVDGVTIDVEQNLVTADITGMPGNYMLADAYEWYKSQGIDASEYAYEPPTDLSEWEKQRDTGSIMELVDIEWMNENAPVFHVSTPEQLASVVYYMNTQNPSQFKNADIYLEDDIDLTGYDWKPIGWTEGPGETYGFYGIVDGQGHTIKGMTIDCDNDDAGFISYSAGIVMKDISFVDADVRSSGKAAICAAETVCAGVWENVHVSGNVSPGVPGDCAGLTAWATDLAFEDCSADYTENNGTEHYHYLTYQEKRREEIGVEETFTLTLNDDNSVTCDYHEGYRNLMFHIEWEGQTILERGPAFGDQASKAITLGPDWCEGMPGTYKVYMIAFVEDVYIRVSNIIEVTVE